MCHICEQFDMSVVTDEEHPDIAYHRTSNGCIEALKAALGIERATLSPEAMALLEAAQAYKEACRDQRERDYDQDSTNTVNWAWENLYGRIGDFIYERSPEGVKS
jgi:bifunctional pyridoxal-dependent enzyme with beta-cystathionase and maltose regulon repressor activities